MIVWGTKTVFRKLGFVADFCPICRQVTAFRIRRIGSAGHIYFVALGQGQLCGYELTCESCRHASLYSPQSSFRPCRQFLSMDQLIAESNPSLPEEMAGRMRLEEEIRSNPSGIPADVREELIAEPFMKVSPLVEERFSSVGKVDGRLGLTLLMAVAGVGLAALIATAEAPDHAGLVTGVAAGVAVVLVSWVAMGAGRRFFQRSIIPLLQRSLQPLSPSSEEITAVLDQLRQQGHKIGARMKPEWLVTALAEIDGA